MSQVYIESNVKDPERIKSRRAQIVQAAVRLFIDKGFHPTTTREIARESGLSNGAVYEYVKSKEDILYLVCRHIHGEMEQGLLDNVPEGATGAVRLQRAIEAFFNVVNDMQDEVLLIYQESKSLPQPFLSEVLARESEIAKVFENLLAEGIEDRSLAVDRASIPLLAHQIVVSGQMWAFRRWALQDFPFQRFRELQVSHLMQACGLMKDERHDKEDNRV